MTRKKILTDHKKKGKKLIPPLAEFNIGDYSYVTEGIPQIIWLALLNKHYGIREGTDLALKFAKLIDDLKIKKDVPYYLSWFTNISVNDCINIKKKLIEIKVYDKMNFALSPLLNIYPDCPLNDIFSSEIYTEDDILTIKEVLISLYQKRGKESTFALGSVIYLMCMCKKLRLIKNSPLSDLPELIDYPSTEKSKIIASSIRATTNILLSSNSIENSSEWVAYFWNRGLEIEPNII